MAAQSSSWVSVPADSDFPLANLPYGVFSSASTNGEAHIGVAIGEQILDLHHVATAHAAVFGDEAVVEALKQTTLNAFMQLKKAQWTATRATLTSLLSANGDASVREDAKALVAQADANMLMPVNIGDYTDFYASREHATNVGTMFRGKDNALQPNWLHLPVGYHGRASSIVVSGVDVHRPCGQTRPDLEQPPVFGPSRLLDFELEMGFFLGGGNQLGHRIKMEDAEEHLFGFCLLNDLSARDIQKWEYVPLGPFNGKNFCSSIGPWIVTMDALEPFRVQGPEQTDPQVLPYLKQVKPCAYDISLSVEIQPEGGESTVVCRSNLKNLYWPAVSMIVHHSSTGCNMRAGDLLGSGTISGSDPSSYGSMLELSWKGTKPLTLKDGSQRKFLANNDTVIMRGFCEKDGLRIGFGNVTTKVLPALE